MAWYNEKFECPNPPDCAANQMVPPSEWNAMVAYLKDKIRGMLFTVPGAGDDGKYIKYVHGTPGFVLDTPAGGGDMLKSVYDIGDNGIVDNSEKVDGCDAGIATGNVFKIPAGIAQGDIFYVNASGNIVRLAAGTNGHFLKTQGAAANPIWAAGAGGVTTWLELTDTPSAFTGQAGKLPKVNAGATALEFGMLESDIFKKDGSVAMTWDIDMAASDVKNCFRVIASHDYSFLTLYGGVTLASNSYIRVYGKDATGNLGKITFEMLNAAKTGRVMGGYFSGATNTPKLTLNHGLITDTIAEKTAAAGVTVDTCLIKDGKAANSDKVGGKQLADLLEVAAGDFNAFTEKVSPVNADIVLIEDSAASYAKKKVQVGNLPGGGGSSTWLGLTDTPGAFDNGKIVKSGAAALSFGMLESDIFKKDGTVAMTGNLDMGGYTIFCPELNPSGDSSDLKIEGGAGAWNPQIRLYGKNHLSNAGLINFGVPNAAKSALLTVLQIDGVSDNPIINWYYPIKVDAINEKTVNTGVTIDTCLIKDGKAADTLKIKGKTVDDAAIGDDKILVYKTTGDKLVYETKPTGGGQEIVAATLIVAANDSKDKNRADYQCDGVEDNVQIQQALDALTAVDGKVVLLEGNYSGILDIDIESNQALVGQGSSTRLSGMDIEIEANASEIIVADMYVNGNIDFKTFEIKDSIFRHLSGLDFACQNMASTSEGNLFDGVRAKQFKINGKHNRFSDCYAYIPSGTGICFNLLGTATKNWLSNCHAYNAYDEDYFIQGTENHLIGCTSKDNRYISIWISSAAHRNVITGGMIDGGNVGAAGWTKLIRVQGDDNKISDMYIIVRETKTTHAIIVESGADGNMITDMRFKNEGVGSPAEFSDSGTNTRLRDNVGFDRAWVTDV